MAKSSPFRRDLARLERSIRAAAAAAAEDAAGLIADAVRGRAPTLSGRARASVEVVPGPAEAREPSSRVVVSGGHETPFIGHVEFGRAGQPANPFIRRGFDGREGRAAALIVGAVAKSIP